MKQTIDQKEILDLIYTIESRPRMYGSTVKEIESQVHILFSLLFEREEYKEYNLVYEKLIRKILGKKCKPNVLFSYQIKEDDFVAMVDFIKEMRKQLNIPF